MSKVIYRPPEDQHVPEKHGIRLEPEGIQTVQGAEKVNDQEVKEDAGN